MQGCAADRITGLLGEDKHSHVALTVTPSETCQVANWPNVHVFGLWEELAVQAERSQIDAGEERTR